MESKKKCKMVEVQLVVILLLVGMGFAYVMGACGEKRYQYLHAEEPEVIYEEVYIYEDTEPSNLTNYEQAQIDIFRACIENDLNYNLVFAICRLETGNFKSAAFKEGHNYCGISVAEQPLSYATKSKGLEAMVKCMQLYRGKTIDQMAKKYCPPNHKSWANSVKNIIKEEGGNADATM